MQAKVMIMDAETEDLIKQLTEAWAREKIMRTTLASIAHADNQDLEDIKSEAKLALITLGQMEVRDERRGF